MSLPQQYDTKVGSYSSRLSGGEKQWIAIARPIKAEKLFDSISLLDQDIFLFNDTIKNNIRYANQEATDEATASLDIENELLVKQAIANLLKKDKTVIMIAHTLSVVKHADHIIVVSDGRIVEQGTHEQLLSMNGKYASMWEIDAKLNMA